MRSHRQYAASLLLATALALPRLLLPPGFMPGADHAGHWRLVFCDPVLRAASSGHVHSQGHGHDHGASEACPFGMSGGPALLAAQAPAAARGSMFRSVQVNSDSVFAHTRHISANGARAPPLA
ncbi:MAG TPA: hypothetical protein VE046_02805 [Steroidobacteraceae bacterium]|nr:hypothetical protein [Steroidobacteraceae bacterium]